MTTLSLPFIGLQPRYKNTAKGDGYASVAIDVDLSDGTLKPLRSGRIISTDTPTGNGFLCGCIHYDVAPCALVSDYYNQCKYTIIGDRDNNTIRKCEAVDVVVPLRFLPPPMPPVATAQSPQTVSEKSSSRKYQYTYVNVFGFESYPSMASNDIVVEDGSPVLLTDFFDPPQDQQVTHIRIYRVTSGYDSGSEEVHEFDTHALFVDEIPVDQLSYLDSIKAINLGKVLVHKNHNPLPDTIHSVQSVTDTGFLVGFGERRVHFSLRSNPFSYPIGFETTFPSVIGVCPAYDHVVVFGREHVSVLDLPDLENMTCSPPIVNQNAPTPIVNMDSRKYCLTPIGVIYVSDEGLVLVGSDGVTKNLTDTFFSIDDWRRLRIETMRIGYHRRQLHFTSDTHSYVLHLSEEPKLVESSLYPTRYAKSDNGELLFYLDNSLYQFDAGFQYLPLTYELTLDSVKTKFSWAKIKSENGDTEIDINGVSGVLLKSGHHHISPSMKSNRHTIRFTGSSEVYKVYLSSNKVDLRNANF